MGKKRNAKQLHQTSINKRKEKYGNSTGGKLKTYHQMEEMKSSTTVNTPSFSPKNRSCRIGLKNQNKNPHPGT